MAKYELWDTNTANLLAVYPDEDSALAMIRASVAKDGSAPWQDVGLLKVGDTEDEDELIAEGEALIDRARPRATVKRTTGGSGSGASGTMRTSGHDLSIRAFKPFGGYDFGAICKGNEYYRCGRIDKDTRWRRH